MSELELVKNLNFLKENFGKKFKEYFNKEKMEWLKKLVEDQREYFPPATEYNENYKGFHLALNNLLSSAQKSLEDK